MPLERASIEQVTLPNGATYSLRSEHARKVRELLDAGFTGAAEAIAQGGLAGKWRMTRTGAAPATGDGSAAVTADLVTVHFGDTAYIIPRPVAERVARLRDAGDAFAAMALARDNHAGTPNIVPDGGRVSVALALMDHLPERFKQGLKDMGTAPYISLNDANAEIERLRRELDATKGIAAALQDTQRGQQATNGRPVLNDAQMTSLRDEAMRAMRDQEARFSQTPAGRCAARQANAWKAAGA